MNYYLIRVLSNGLYHRLGIETRDVYLDYGDLGFYCEPGVLEKIKKQMPLHIFDANSDNEFKVLEVTLLDDFIKII